MGGVSGWRADRGTQSRSADETEQRRMIGEFDLLLEETQRNFRHDFRTNATRLVRESGEPVSYVAQALGIPVATLDDWVEQDRQEPGDQALQPSTADLPEELSQLRRENARLRSENARLRLKLGP
jgi:transposase-like protein